MKTKNIFKALAAAMLMPAMLLTTACSNEDDLVNAANTENTINKGYALPVTVNVTRQGDEGTTRATYTDNGDGTGSLAFSDGDKLFVEGSHIDADRFAGTLKWQSGGTFSGTIYTESLYEGTIDDLLDGNYATLLPAGYKSYDYLDIIEDEYEYEYHLGESAYNSFATSKAAGVEQLSYETGSYTSGTGFVLEPQNAILNFTITGLTASTEVTATLTDGSPLFNIEGDVTTDGSGNATFAMGVTGGFYDIKDLTLSIGANTIDITNSSITLVAGKIYNIERSAAPALTYPIALGDATSDYVGSVVTTDGNVYATVAAASAASKTAVAVIAYVGTAGSVDASSATYKGLAVALSDANSGSNCTWAEDFANCLSSSQTSDISTALGFKNGIACTSTLTSDGHTHAAATAAASNNGTTAPTGTSGWFMPSMGQWNLIVQGLASKKGGSAVTTDLTYMTENTTYKADNLNSVITDAGGTGFRQNTYWASTEASLAGAWAMDFYNGYAIYFAKSTNRYVRSIIAF